ncbi:MSCRAMM family protein, partial [Dapis sp. BLCC M172]|uniref:MSCRAMM family protein n=1 Tax=Dapis sp. BLCC M172 TaxID=2975281 RepID=UPI003CE80917
MLDGEDDVIATTTTDVDGNYEFTDLEAGDYTVRQTNLDGYSDVSDTDPPNDDNLISVTLPGDEDSTGNDFVDEQVGTISGTVFEDTDNDGTGDTPLEGVELELQDDQGQTVGTTTTNEDGTYSFTDVAPGEYSVIETNLPGYEDVSEVDGGDDEDHPDNGIVNNIPVTVAPGEDDTGNDFVDEIVLGSISGQVTDDENNPLENVPIELFDEGGNSVGTTTTDASGNYSFTDVAPGNYNVVETNLPGYEDVSEVDGGDDGDNEDNGIVNNIPVTVDPGEADTGKDFVDAPNAGSISGQVTDNNGNGLGGVTIELQLPDGTTVGTPITTNPDGTYSFTGVEPGNYNVIETNLPNYSDVSEVDGGDDGDNEDNGIVNNI